MLFRLMYLSEKGHAQDICYQQGNIYHSVQKVGRKTDRLLANLYYQNGD